MGNGTKEASESQSMIFLVGMRGIWKLIFRRASRRGLSCWSGGAGRGVLFCSISWLGTTRKGLGTPWEVSTQSKRGHWRVFLPLTMTSAISKVERQLGHMYSLALMVLTSWRTSVRRASMRYLVRAT